MAVKDGGANMQPEFDRLTRLSVPNYEPAESAAWIQDELRQRIAGAGAEGGRQTLGDPEENTNEVSAGRANTPVKPTRLTAED